MRNRGITVRIVWTVGFLILSVLYSWSTAMANCGSPTCEVYTDLQNNRCYKLQCAYHYQSGCTSLSTTGCRYIPARCATGSAY